MTNSNWYPILEFDLTKNIYGQSVKYFEEKQYEVDLKVFNLENLVKNCLYKECKYMLHILVKSHILDKNFDLTNESAM